jgi:Flp pilus assembly secretin CpaC
MMRNGLHGLALFLVVAAPALAGPNVPGVSQVQLDVVVAEVNVEAEGLLGLPAAKDSERSGEKNARVLTATETARVQEALRILRDLGLVKTLSEPRVVTLSGRPASSLTGGEAAIPVPAGRGPVGVQFVEFGTRLNFLPIVRGDKIYLEVEMEVSTLKAERATANKSPAVPSRETTRTKTAAELSPDQTLVLLGETTLEKTGPTRNCRRIVLVTPHLVQSQDASGLPRPPVMIPRPLDAAPGDLVPVKAETVPAGKTPSLWPLKIETGGGRVQVRCPQFEATADRLVQDTNRIVLEGKVQLVRKGEGDGLAIEMTAEKVLLQFEGGKLQIRAAGKE